jgi:hypothetical protein
MWCDRRDISFSIKEVLLFVNLKTYLIMYFGSKVFDFKYSLEFEQTRALWQCSKLAVDTETGTQCTKPNETAEPRSFQNFQ